MFNKQNNEPIKIGILEASPQNKAILEFFFNSSGKSVFKESKLDDASAFIIDFDYPGSKDHWEELFKATRKPGIIISMKEVKLPFTIWIAKPLTTKALIEAGKKVKDLLVQDIKQEVVKEPAVETEIIETQSEKTVIDETLLNVEKNTEKTEEILPEKTIELELDTEQTPEQEINTESDAEIPLADFETMDDLSETTVETSESVELEKTIVEEDVEVQTEKITTSDDTLLTEVDIMKQSDDLIPELVVEKEVKVEIKQTEKQKATAELAFAGSDEDMMALDFSTGFEDVVETTTSTPEKTTTKEPSESLELMNAFGIDSFDEEDFVDDTAILKISAKDNAEEKTILETAIPIMTEFAISPTLVSLDDEDNKNKSEELLDKTPEREQEISDQSTEHLEEENLSLKESEIDSLLQTLISGGKSNDHDTELLANSDASENLAENSKTELFNFDNILVDDGPNDKENIATEDKDISPEISDTDDALEENTLPDTGLLDFTLESTEVENPQDLESLRTVEDDGSSIELGVLTETTDSLENSDFDTNETPTAEEIGGNVYIDPAELQEKAEDEEEQSAEDELQDLLDEIRKEAESASVITSQESSTIFSESSDGPTSNHIPTTAESRWALTCGTNKKITTAKNLNKNSFDLNDYMLSALLKVVEQSKQSDSAMRLKLNRQIIVIDYSSDFIYYNKSIFTNNYARLCQHQVKPNEVKVHDLDKSEIRLYHKKMEEGSENSHSIESFIWTTSLLTSQGRLPKDTDLNKKVGLKYWPNLTRLEQIPNAMQIAAIFYKHPGSLIEITNWSNIDQRYIFAFYNAALSLNLIELDGKKIRSTSNNIEKASKQTKNRGFFSRLLKRIKS